jgi:hypothetical protein
VQIAAGFFADGLLLMAQNKGARAAVAGEKKFLRQIGRRLEEQGFMEHQSKEEVKRKKSTIRMMLWNLIGGVPLSGDVQTTVVRGVCDPTLFTQDFCRRIMKQINENPGSLGTQIVKNEEANKREFGIRMRHLTPFYRPNEIKRLQAVVETLEQQRDA